jgi:hypothetical protein
MQFKFHTKLSKDECVKRLNEASRQKFFSLGNDIIGKVKGDNFCLRSVQHAYLDTFNKSLSGSLQPVSDGTDIIVGRTTIFTKQNILLLLLLIFLSLVASRSLDGDVISFLKVIIILGVFIFIFIRFRSTPSHKFFNFIQETLEAEKVN